MLGVPLTDLHRLPACIQVSGKCCAFIKSPLGKTAFDSGLSLIQTDSDDVSGTDNMWQILIGLP